ncbi:MAG: DUF433 domain-containing protein [Draconibacterium sp.]|nr:DUF433 domain-containing protein [Draconibacterium sp.]
MVNWTQHIGSNPEVLYGKPTILKTRIPVYLILEKLAAGYSHDELIDAYPKLHSEDIIACLLFASEAVKNELVFPKAS